ncbi:hypothetical protein [Mycobacteroides abscessus]|uniref:hypothetical protein n=1 Tax=Mycobacteroides abscessus TaxID=36809 RepID=UPI001F1F3D10|nr:hypothetical protein [Mycobacteroides abscessus]
MTGGVGSPPMGASPAGSAEGTGAVPDTPGVSPVDTGACADPGVVGAVLAGSWWAVALDTAVAMVCAAAGRSGSGRDVILGRAGDLEVCCCSVGWWACPAGALAGVLGDLAALVLGAVDCPPPPTRLASVGFTACGAATDVTDAPEPLGDSVVVGGVFARGIGGSS